MDGYCTIISSFSVDRSAVLFQITAVEAGRSLAPRFRCMGELHSMAACGEQSDQGHRIRGSDA
jgi:hypothetical protein